MELSNEQKKRLDIIIDLELSETVCDCKLNRIIKDLKEKYQKEENEKNKEALKRVVYLLNAMDPEREYKNMKRSLYNHYAYSMPFHKMQVYELYSNTELIRQDKETKLNDLIHAKRKTEVKLQDARYELEELNNKLYGLKAKVNNNGIKQTSNNNHEKKLIDRLEQKKEIEFNIIHYEMYLKEINKRIKNLQIKS